MNQLEDDRLIKRQSLEQSRISMLDMMHLPRDFDLNKKPVSLKRKRQMKSKGVKKGNKKGFVMQPTDDIEVIAQQGSKVFTIHPFELKKGIKRKTLIKKVMQYISQFDGRAKVATQFNGVWRSGKWVNTKHPNQDKVVWNPKQEQYAEEFWDDEHDLITKFDIYIEEVAGGCEDEFNDCLHDCLWEAFNGSMEKFEDPYQLKKMLGLARKARVPVSMLDKVEESMKVNINVKGDATRKSKSTHMRTIWLRLRDGHYTLMQDPKRQRPFGIFDKPRKPCIFHYVEDGIRVLFRHTEKVLSKEDFAEVKESFKCIKYEPKKRRGGYTSMREHMTAYKQDTNALRGASIGLIDQDRFLTPAMGAIALWYKYIKAIPEPETIKSDEGQFMHPFFHGAYMWAKPYTGKAWKYDINSFYPALMSERVMLPMKRGTFQTIEEVPDYIAFGLYKCEIESGAECFHYMDNNCYTHYDLKRARELGLKLKMIDDSPNAITWGARQLIRSDYLFKDYVDWIYQIKQNEPLAKEYANSLWGALCCTRQYEERVTLGEDPMQLEGNREVLDFVRVGKKVTVKYANPEVYYRTNWARIGAFITGYGRYKISQAIEKYREHIVWIHTDGFATSQPIDLPLSSELGGWKLEKVGDVVIKNVTSIKWQ